MLRIEEDNTMKKMLIEMPISTFAILSILSAVFWFLLGAWIF